MNPQLTSLITRWRKEADQYERQAEDIRIAVGGGGNSLATAHQYRACAAGLEIEQRIAPDAPPLHLITDWHTLAARYLQRIEAHRLAEEKRLGRARTGMDCLEDRQEQYMLGIAVNLRSCAQELEKLIVPKKPFVSGGFYETSH